ncbi:helix-turn-helix domain-containing protein [Enterococcus bulliens]
MRNNISYFMERSNMTVTELAKKSNLGRTLVSELVNSYELPVKTKLDSLLKISDALKISIYELLNYEHEPKQNEITLKKFLIDSVQEPYKTDNSIHYNLVLKNKEDKKILAILVISSGLKNTEDNFERFSSARLHIVGYENFSDNDFKEMILKEEFDDISIFMENTLNSKHWGIFESQVFTELSIEIGNLVFKLSAIRICLYDIKTRKFKTSRRKNDGTIETP